MFSKLAFIYFDNTNAYKTVVETISILRFSFIQMWYIEVNMAPMI